MKTQTLWDLLEDKDNRKPDGGLTNEAYAAYQKAAKDKGVDFIPEDELKTTTVSF